MRLLSSFISLCLTLLTRSKIIPWGTFNTTNYHEDTLQYNLTELFDFSQSKKWSCDVVTSPASIFDQNTSIQTKDLSIYEFVDIAETAEFISNTTFFAIYDDSHILIQNVNLDGESFGDLTVHTFGRPGVNAVCTDVVLNPTLNRAYITCHSAFTSKMDKYIYVAEVDATTGVEINLVTWPMDPQFPTAHRLRIGLYDLWPADSKGAVSTYVIVYDQGGASAYSSSNQWFYVLSGAQTGNLKPEGYASLNTPDLAFKTMFDIYSFQNQLLVSGRDSSDKFLGFAYCYFTLGKTIAVNCTSFKQTSMLETLVGYVGIMNTGQYIEINNSPSDPNQRSLLVCDIIDSFYSLNFIDKDSCRVSASYVLPADVYITKVEGNVHQVVTKYAHFDGTYAGYSSHNFDLNQEFADIDDSQAPQAIPLGKTLVLIGKDSMRLTRQVKPYLFIRVDDAQDDSTSLIRVDCADEDGSVSNFVTVYKMSDMRKHVVGAPESIPSLALYPGTDVTFQLDPHEVMGNDLKLFVDAESEVAGLTNFLVYDTESINVNFESASSSGRFSSLYFSGKYAIAKDALTYKIIVFVCGFGDLRNLRCYERAAFGIGTRNAQLQEDIVEVFDYLFAWSTDQVAGHTTVYIFDGEQAINTFSVDGVATDAMMVEIGNKAYLALAFQAQGRVKNFVLTQGDAHDLNPIEDIDQPLSSREFFCPKNISFSPLPTSDDTGVIEILSVCPGKDQRILRYKYPPQVVNKRLVLPLINTVPINFAYSDPLMCSMGTEFVVWANLNSKVYTLQSLNTVDDRNSWSFGVNDFDLGTLTSFDCVQRAGIFTTLSTRNGEKVLSVWWGNNQHQANHRLYNTLRSGLGQYKEIRSFELYKQVIHVAKGFDGGYDFFFTWSVGPVVDLNFLYGFPLGKTNLIFKYFNHMQGGRLVYTKEVRIIAPRTDVSFAVTQKLTKPQTGYLNIEDYISITGPVIHSRILGNESIQYKNRIYRVSEYHPTPEHVNTFQHVETYGDIVVGVHIAESNASTFTVFHDINQFVGLNYPSHGVNAFHFAPFQSDKSCILIVYSTAEPSGNSLQLVALKGADRISITHSQDGLTLNYTKIRVVPLTIPNTDSWRIFALNEADGHMSTFTAQMDGSKISLQFVDNHTDVSAFTWVSPKNSNSIYIFYVPLSDKTAIQVVDYPKNATSGNFVARRDVLPATHLSQFQESLTPFQILSIECRDHDDSKFYCLVNSLSPFIQELIYDSTNFSVPEINNYYKVPGYQGKYMDANRNHFVLMAATSKPSFHVKYLVYKRGSPDVFSTQDGDTFRPFTLGTCRHNNTHFQFSSAFPTVPIFFLAIGPIRIDLPDQFNLSTLSLDIESPVGGQPDLLINLGSIFEQAPLPSVKWWSIFLILAILVVAAVAFIVLNSSPKTELTKEDIEAYNSLKAEAAEAEARSSENKEATA